MASPKVKKILKLKSLEEPTEEKKIPKKKSKKRKSTKK